MDFYRHSALNEGQRHISFVFVYFLAIVFSYHTLLVAYITSSYAGNFLSESGVGLLHGLAAAVSVVAFFYFPRVLQEFGNVLVGILLMISLVMLLITMAINSDPLIVLPALFLFLALNPIGYLIIDVFSETLIGTNNGGTGAKRGLTLALMSAAAVMAPISMGYLLGDQNDYTQLFFAAAGIGLLFIAVIVGSFRQFYDPPYEVVPARTLLKKALVNRNISTVLACHLLLQIFFAWIIIFVPLYLSSVLGFSWAEIGVIIAAGLSAYVIFEYPIGVIADRYLGEQEMMALGFVILAITTASIGLVGAGVVAFMILMFINRIGASFVEVTTESYFFKQIDGKDTHFMSLFRLLRPAANVVGALIGGVALLFLPFPVFFIVGGLLLVSGVYLTRYLVDTK